MIQIKRNNKVFFTLEDFGEGSKLSYQLMDHHYIILKFTTATPVYFEIGDSVEIPDFGYFELTSSYFPKHNDSDGYDYEMQMDAYYMSWKNKLCKYRPQHGANETSFKLTTTVGVHMNVILGNLKALGLTYNGKEFSVDYTTYNNKAFDVQKRFLIEYGSISILDALNAICSEDALNCEWWIDGSIIYLGYCEMEGQATFEQDVNVLSMSYSESKSTYITRLYAFGSDRNIPKGYFTGADADVTTDGVATDYLMLPNKEVDSDGFYAKDGYLENVNVVKNDKQAIEGVVMFEEEYPKVESVVSSIKTYDSTVNNEDGTKTTQTFWQVTSTDSFTNSFKESWIKSNLTLGIKFTSGALMGMEFDVSFKVIDKVNYFEIVANDTYGRTLPDGVMCPKVGDKYFLFNWDATKITDTDLIPTAQLSLFDRAKQYYQKTMISNSNFTCTMDGNKFYNDGTYDYHPLGEQVKLINDMFAQVDADGKHYRNSRIIGMEIPLDIPYDHPQYTVGEKAATSRLGKLEDKVDSITVNGMQIGSTGSGNGGVYVIGLNDSTPASDSNVYSARRSRMEFLSRLQDSTAKGTITWEKVQKFICGLIVGNINNENGGSWTPDAEGRSHLITDYLEVRMKAIFEELVIKKTSTIGGKEIISPAGGVVAHKVEEVTVTYNEVSQKAYRCYFLAEQDGDEVDNDFVVEDQVRSESFNLNAGKYHKTGNHFFWRMVIGIDEEPVELEGKKYHYIDLSDTDCATASDVPAKGDVLSQCGNRTDVERQNCLIFSAVDTYSPSISLYHGINSYSFANREYVEYGVNKQTNKAFFNVYGDMYVGDRPTKENNYEGSSYIKYDSATKQVSVKGKISAKSTVDGKELSQYIKENSAKGLTEEQVNNIINNSQVIADLQNQVDGAIETWFYDGVPTLSNKPASDWKTDKDKNIHLGDLYYDNKTGKAYRFAKDGNIYKWTIITDTDIAKALSDASKAQETADGKMKVFSTQPTPPYQLGDIWVNATYPTDGSIYKNEVLRCQTNKAAGSQFDIADWIKASKYTDDTVANAAKAAAEKAQKAAETAQTNVTNLDKTVTSNKKAFDSYVTDGYLEPSEIAAMAQDSKRLEDAFAAAEKSYTEVKEAEVLKSTKELTDLNTAFATLTTAKTELVTYLSDISSRYNAADTNGKATIVSAVGTKFTNFQSAYSAFYDKLGLANAYITSKIYGDLKQNITDLAGYKYIKDALGQTTDIDGGLVMTTLLALRDADGNVQSGINGAIDTNRGKKSIATWWGGQMVDKDYNSGNLTPATSLIRFDGSGYLAKGAIWWDVSGKVHADPTSFIISEKNLGAYLAFFEPTWKSGSNGTNIKDLVALTPQAPFTTLSVSNDLLVEGKLKLGSITLSVVNGALKIDGDVYSTGGMSAYGDGTNNGGGGGLVASVKSYTDIIKGTYTDNDLASIPNAYAIKALSNRIDNISSELGGLSLDWANITGKPSAFTPSAHTHKWVDITDRITKVSQLTNDSGYTTNKGTVTSVKLTLPTGLSLGTTKEITTSGTFSISLTSGYSIPTTSKQGQWDSAYNWYKLMTTDEETADGVINKWNEVVDFLAGIAQTDSLDSILSGINKSITDETNRAKKAEGANATNIATNKANITTLQGYFTNGSAKSAMKLTNARKLWGNSFDGTADISGSIVVPSGKYITIGNIKLEYDATNKALKITNTSTNEVANLYTSGGVSAYGVGTTSSGSTGGGGLNGTVKSYNDAKSLTSESLSEVASAYSVAALYSSINDAIGRINTLEGGSATSIEVTGNGNAVTSVSKVGTKLTFTKGATFLTSHQDISGKSDKTHTHSVKINGVTKTIAATGGTAVDLGTYLTSHQSLAAYLKSADAEKTYSKLGHTHAFSEITGKPTTLAGYGVTDGVNAVSVTGNGNAVTSASIDGHTLTLTKGSTFSLSGHTHTFASLTSKPTTIAGYGITDAYTKAQVDSTIAKYLPLAGGTITGALTVNGIATFKSKVAIGDIYIINDGSGNLYVQKTDGKTAANFYATGGITAFGASSVSGGTGGGLNGSVLGFEKATAMTSADNGDSSKTEVSFLATAWSIKQLNDKINAFGTGVFSDYLTIAAAKATYQPKGSYLTSHQTIYGLTIQKNGTSLGTYTPNSAAKTINVTVPTKLSELSNDSGYTKNTGTVTSVAVSVPTGLSVSGSPITTKGTIAIALASGYSIPTTAKQTNWDKVYNWYTGITATDTDDIINKWQEVIAFLDGISSSTDLNAIVDGINTSISNEVTRAKAAESTLTTNLNSEIKRAKSAESTLTTNLNAEITRAKSAESTLTTNLNNEITRAKNAENTLNNKFANYLPLAGGTMTGVLALKGSMYEDAYKGALNMQNSNIFGLNSIYTSDKSDSQAEGIHFYRDATHVDTLRMMDGKLLFTPNRELGNTATEYEVIHSGTIGNQSVNYASNAGNADTLDGVHASGLFTNLSNSGNNISITIGGTNKTLTAAYATNCDTVDGYHAGLSHKPYGTIPVISSSGMIELGHYIDFHHDNTTGSDYSVRLQTNGNHSNVVTLPTATGTLALTSDNVASATKLANTRTIWGQSFNGTANVSGNMTGVGNINTSAAPAGTIYTNNWFRSKGSTGWYSEDHGGGWYMSDNTWIRNFGSKDVYLSNKLSVNGNVGIGTTSPSYKLHVVGDIYTTTKVNINGIVLEKDSDGNLKVNGNLYATGGISAYGTSSAGSGGGLSGSVLAWDSAIKMPNATNGSSDTTKTESSFLASAWSVKKLYDKVASLEGGSAMNVSVSGSGNAVTSITKNGTTINVTKGATFLTAHQSLSAYMKTADAKALFLYHTRENIVTDLDNFNTNGASHIYELHNVANAPTDNSWLQVMNWGSIDKDYGMLLANEYSINGNLYFRQKVAGKWKAWKTLIDSSNIASQSVKYATTAGSANAVAWTNVSGRPSTMKNPSALSWSGYSTGSYDGSAAKSISIPNNTNQLTNGAGFITASASITGNAATATKVNHSLSVFGKSFNGSADVTVADTDLIASISTAKANLTDKTEILTSWASDNGFNDSNAKNKIYRRPASAIWGYINSKTISNADKLDNVHLNGIFTALSNTNNGVSMTIGTVAKSLANMQVYSATKLVTARNIALNGDLTGNANFDGSANITINGYMSYCNAIVGNTNTYPWRRIAKVNEITGNYADGCILLYISEGFIGGCYGIARVYIRTDNLSTGANASCSIQWISRNGYGLDSLKIAMYKTTGKAYYDVFLKMRGTHASVVIRTLQDQRGSLGKRFTLVNSIETSNAASHTEAYATIEDAATAIHNQAYTSIAQGSDVATVHNADMVDGIHANGLFTNLSNSGNSLSITVGGTNKTLTVNYASNAGNADTLDGVHASGLFTNLSNSGNNISITIGGTNKTLTAAYATNCDTVDGYHAQLGSSKPYGKIPVIGTDGVIELGHYIDFHHDNTTGSDYSVRLQTNGNHSNVVTLPTATGTLALTSDNVASATKLANTRTIWGQSFNGTGNVSGALSGATTISASNTISTSLQNGALKIGNKSAPISAIDAQVIFNTGAAIRFGETNWDWNQWAGLKYTHSNKTVYLGIADGSVFNANNAQSGGKLQLKAIDRILFDSDSDSFQIHCDNNNDYLRIGSSDNSGYVLVSDIGNWDTDDNGDDTNNWLISIDGTGTFKSIYCPGIYTANSIISTRNKALLLSGNVIREYHRDGSPYYSSITFNETTLALNAYGNIGLTSRQGITIDGGNGTISMVATGGFDVTYRAASLSVSQTGASEYTWTFNNGSIKTTGGITAYQSSDERLKHNIHGVDSLAIIKAMGGTVAFRYNEDDKASIGWIAQRVLHNTLMQDLVEKDEDGYLKINYWSPKLIAVAFGAIEQVDDEVSRLKRRVRDLENEVEQLKSDRL